MKEPLISVIVPVYNVEAFLPYCLDSIINQTYQNLEIILVNDGSTDNSKLICEKYQANDKRIKLINQENKGVSVARNVGLDNAKGEYIGFIDSDDIVSLDFYKCLLDLITKTNSDIAECESVQISERDLFNKKFEFKSSNDLKYITVDKMGALNRIHDEDIHIVGKSLVVWNKLYKHNLFDNIRYPVGKRYEDDFTTYKIFYKINQLVSTDRILYAYVQRKSSMMHQKFSIKRLDALEAFDSHVEFFKTLPDRHLFEKCLLRYLRILVKILYELYESDCEGKEEIKKILKNKFEQIYALLEEFPDDSISIRPNNMVQAKHFYYKEFYNLLNPEENEAI